ncbi:MAG: hypothetical protein RIF33_21515 [Cyclobacteriaceae bacterium]
MKHTDFSRRTLVKSSLLGALAISAPNIIYAKTNNISSDNSIMEEDRFYLYPAIDDETAKEVVGKSHSDYDKVKALVTKRPELSRATWDWGFGDWETAIDGASHMGRRDIAQLLIEFGARPTIFTYAMLGELEVVKAIVAASPGIQSIGGPHGITLLRHAKAGLRMDTMTEIERGRVQKVIDYLEALGDANMSPESTEISDKEKERYQGEYRYGEGENDIFFIGLNMRKSLSFGKKGTFGTGIYKRADGYFGAYAAPSIKVGFELSDDKVTALILEEPDLTIKAMRIT